MRCDSRDVDLPGAQVDQKQHVIRHQPPQRPDLGGEKVGRDQHLHMRADKLRPRAGRLPLWSWRDAMTFENVAHGLVTKRVPEVGEGADDAIIPPGAIFLGHAYHQVLYFLVDRRATGSIAVFGAIKLLGHKLPVPSENGVRLDDCRHVLEGLLAELLANLSERFALAITQPYAPFDLVSQHAISGDEILIAYQ